MGTTTKSRNTKKSVGLTPNQQWLALGLVVVLGILAVFWFGILTGDDTGGGGHAGFLIPVFSLGAARKVVIPLH